MGWTASYAELAAEILARPARLGPVRLIAVDGPSGAGKTAFALRLAAALAAELATGAAEQVTSAVGLATGAAGAGTGGAAPAADRGESARGVPVVHTDDLLEGWDDQLTFWPRLDEQVLEPLRRARPARYHRYDWQQRRFAGGLVRVPPAPAVLLEGVTAARAAIRPELTLSVFVTAPAPLCLARTLARDGESMRPYLEQWQRRERRHFAADATAEHADVLVDGAANGVSNSATRYVRLR